MTCSVCGVTACLAGVFVFDGNLVLSVLMCSAGETFVVRLCVSPSEVELWFAPSEVHYCPLGRWGGAQLSIFVVWRLREYWPGVAKLSFSRRRPYKMVLPVEDVIGRK
jgi:hypothetical protein